MNNKYKKYKKINETIHNTYPNSITHVLCVLADCIPV